MMKKLTNAIVYFVAFLAMQLLVSYLVCFIWLLVEGKSVSEAWGALGGTLLLDAPKTIVIQVVYGIFVLWLFTFCGWSRLSNSYLRSKPVGVLTWAAIASLGSLIPSLAFQELMPLPDNSSELMGQVMDNRWGYLAICIFAPLVEEVVFRGAILRTLLGGMKYHWVAIALSALLFAVAHVNPAQIPHAFCIGLLLGWMYYRTRSVIPGIMLHWTNNTAAYVVHTLWPQTDKMNLVDLFGGDYTKVAMAVAFSLMIFLPALWQLHMRMRPAAK